MSTPNPTATNGSESHSPTTTENKLSWTDALLGIIAVMVLVTMVWRTIVMSNAEMKLAGYIILATLGALLGIVGYVMVRVSKSNSGQFSWGEFGGVILMGMSTLILFNGVFPDVGKAISEVGNQLRDVELLDPPVATTVVDGKAKTLTIATGDKDASKIFIKIEAIAKDGNAEVIVGKDATGKIWFEEKADLKKSRRESAVSRF